MSIIEIGRPRAQRSHDLSQVRTVLRMLIEPIVQPPFSLGAAPVRLTCVKSISGT
jgi:hypothetical protein